MPNWATTKITIKGVKKDIQEFLDKIKGEDAAIDFNSIIPEPETLEQYELQGFKACNPEEAHIEKDEKRPWFNWYEWRFKFWGCKWNAMHIDVQDKEFKETKDDALTSLDLYFDTPWAPPDPILYIICNELSNKLDLTIKTAEEQGYMGGIITTEKGMVLRNDWYESCNDAYDISEEVIGYSARSTEETAANEDAQLEITGQA